MWVLCQCNTVNTNVLISQLVIFSSSPVANSQVDFNDDNSDHVIVFKEAIKSNGSLTCHIVQCMPFVPPRVGKTCLFHSMLDETPPGTPTTSTTVGSGSLSTDVLSESKMIQVTVKMDDDCGSAVPIVVEEDGKWSLVKTLKDEIALYMKSLYHQSAKSSVLQPTDDQSDGIDTSENETEDNSLSVDDAAIDEVTRHTLNVDLSKIQLLLNKSMTIFYTDTGGQPEFQEVLPLLAAGPTIFLLVFDLHQPLDSPYKVSFESSSNKLEVYNSSFTVREVLMQCLSSISSYHIDQSHDFSQNQILKCSAPPTRVISIATHKDLVSDEVYANVDEDFKKSINNARLSKNCNIIEPFNSNHLIIPINNYEQKGGSNVKKVIERVIKREIKGESPYKVELPANWLCLQLNLRQRGTSTIAYSECLEIARKLGIPDKDLKSCLWYLHYKTGTIRYYDSVKELKDTVIIQPKILFVAITKLIMSTFILDNVEPITEEDFKTLGLFTHDDVYNVFNKHMEELNVSQITALLL